MLSNELVVLALVLANMPYDGAAGLEHEFVDRFHQFWLCIFAKLVIQFAQNIDHGFIMAVCQEC